jgi:hypothetical protein
VQSRTSSSSLQVARSTQTPAARGRHAAHRAVVDAWAALVSSLLWRSPPAPHMTCHARARRVYMCGTVATCDRDGLAPVGSSRARRLLSCLPRPAPVDVTTSRGPRACGGRLVAASFHVALHATRRQGAYGVYTLVAGGPCHPRSTAAVSTKNRSFFLLSNGTSRLYSTRTAAPGGSGPLAARLGGRGPCGTAV